MRLIKDIRLRLVVMTALLIGGLAVLNAQVAVAPAQGDGTEDNPYQIATLENLYWIAASQTEVPEPNLGTRWRSHYIQIEDINAAETREWFNDRGWLPIANSLGSNFRGTYNGQDHIIDSLFVNRRWDKAGLLGILMEATIENLGLTNVDIHGGSDVGALAGLLQSNSYIRNCYSTGYVRGSSNVGGLLGYSISGIISNSYSAVTLFGYREVGGFSGNTGLGATIRNCYSTGNVTGYRGVGGLVGRNETLTIENSYYNYEQVLINDRNAITTGALDDKMFNIWFDNNMSLDIDDYLLLDDDRYIIGSVKDFKKLLAFGQFEDYSYKLTTNLNLAEYPDFYIPYLSGNFDGNGFTVDNLRINNHSLDYLGLFGFINTGSIVKNTGVNDVDVIGYRYIGGLVGNSRGSIFKCYSSGRVAGNSYVGGLVGRHQVGVTEAINNSYSRTRAIGASYVGGLVGAISFANINNSYSTGNVSGGERYLGGLVGLSSNAEITGSYWNIETSGQETSEGGEGRISLEMTYPYDVETYVRWDFTDTWAADTVRINNGYPYLQWQIRSEPDMAFNPLPEDHADSVSVGLNRLGWKYLHNIYHQNPVGFRVYFNDTGEFGEDDEFVWVPYIEGQIEYYCADILPHKLDFFTYYYWKVVPTTKEDGTGDGCDALKTQVWSFYTELSPYPKIADNPFPAEGDENIPVSLERLKWNYHPDPLYLNLPTHFAVFLDPEGEFGDPTDFVWIKYQEDETEYSCSSILPDELQYDTIYYWKVVPTIVKPTYWVEAQNVPVWSFRTQEEPTSADLLHPELVTSLHGNYPNPFNPATKIRFSIKEDNEAVLNIYNIKGQLVKTLHSGLIKAGEHSLIWHGKDDNGREAGSGVYFYRLKTDKYNQVNKMLLVK